MASESTTKTDYDWLMETGDDEASRRHFVFSYGSNMCRGQIAQRCPSARFVDVAVLAGHRWQINNRGYANVVPTTTSDEVWGLVHALSDADLETLDGFEGVRHGVYSRVKAAVTLQGERATGLGRIERGGGGATTPKQRHGDDASRTLRCWLYQDVTNVDDGTPHDEYVDRINVAVLDAALSPHYVRRAVRPHLPERALPSPPPHRLYAFVYGTLKRGGSNHHWLTRCGAQFESTAAVRRARLYRVCVSYPGAVPCSDGESTVLGELFSLPDYSCVDQLDTLEGYRPDDEAASLYVRRPVWIETPRGGLQAVTYWYNRPTEPATLIADGHFVSPLPASGGGAVSYEQAASVLLEQGVDADCIPRLLQQTDNDLHTALALWDALLFNNETDALRCAQKFPEEK